MKILFAVQGTGNGHLSRARDIYPELMKYGEVDLLVSGYQADLSLPYPVKYRLKGLSFIFGRHGGVSLWQTFRRLSPWRFFRDIYHLPVEDYDLVVNDFEPVSAWACKLRKVPCIALSHQSAVVQAASPKPEVAGWFGRFILRYYAPFSSYYGFHFERYNDKIFTPVIRREVQALTPVKGNHYTVYLPAYDDAALIRFLHRFKGVTWEVFSKHNKEAFTFEQIQIRPIENEAFLESLESCSGALLGAGFEGPAEALYLNKKLLVVPMKRQYEQQCNAAAIHRLGVPVIDSLSAKSFRTVHQWLLNDDRVAVKFPRETAAIAVSKMIEDFIHDTANHFNKAHA
ncbi:glycosyltransferase family protein [Taibaiella koreensis]|uniref:glycosyltransferase family protein n=1 Tax=Taibaiella koreensis TaxID=1268548 RepID=UPI000E599A7C|nr:glycosyltransferase family protein [Taibaiella koreensis]